MTQNVNTQSFFVILLLFSDPHFQPYGSTVGRPNIAEWRCLGKTEKPSLDRLTSKLIQWHQRPCDGKYNGRIPRRCNSPRYLRASCMAPLYLKFTIY